ncbi:RNA polymerase II transcription elongation factor-domain-containing protein [Diplogelasinospora grovesii]|uniref:RNA polymerase II transcription elongation factor-domain-containing protein n=1 Tax=Diplogelasinospora grovesii TaxID=303347 RepID=A0AAN6NA07_9PEZI|nr:RNA polymerase II transcription elongation factor-domain-containing protein [Diplogelasinospora grovesii]
MASSRAIDPTKQARYPVILSDALLGKPSKETYTGIRYNHKPALSSDAAPSTARLKKSAKDGSYNLGFEDHGDKYQYNGTRSTEDGKYVLILDPVRKAFVLHRVDSMFHMNVTRTPTNSSVESLRKQFPHLEVKNTSNSGGGSKQQKAKGAEKAEKAAPGKAATIAAGRNKDSSSATPKNPVKPKNKPQKKETVALTLPTPGASAKPSTKTGAKTGAKTSASKAMPPPAVPAEKKDRRRAKSPVEEEEEEDDDDGGLTIEYPGGNPSGFQRRNNFSPAFPAQINRHFSELMQRTDEEAEEVNHGQDNQDDEDADAEFEDVVEEQGFKLPGSVNNNQPNRNSNGSTAVASSKFSEPIRFEFEADEADGEADGNGFVDDLEAELFEEFVKVPPAEAADDDSEVSEEE